MRNSCLVLCLAAGLLLGSSTPAAAQTVAQQPAATLLLPYFEVDMARPNGQTTIFEVNNSSATAVMAHVTVWSDYGVPVLAFNVYLTGFDMQAIDMRDVLNGRLPRTASAGQDPGDTISNQGPFSQDINFASCGGILPPPSQLSPEYIQHIQASLTGGISALTGTCNGFRHGDRFARGYVTVDTVTHCSLGVPSDPGYFVSGGFGTATNQNVLWGDYYLVHKGRNVAAGDTLVHIKADAMDPETSVPGEYTFYGRHVGWTAADNREPLSTTFAVPYRASGNTASTRILAWRDPKVASVFPPSCISFPSWFPLATSDVMAFDEQEDTFDLDTPEPPPVFPPPPAATPAFPLATQAVTVGGDALPTPFDFGWIYMNMNTMVAPAGANPPENPLAAQAWVSALTTSGRYTVGARATRLDSAKDASMFIIGF